jgi:SAM-dependent methyltransferase
MERFYQVDLDDANALDAIPDDYFDAVICSHVLEHLKEPEGVVRKLSHKVGRGGLIFVEAPAAVSLRMPRTREGLLGFRGCLNFWDDATHRRVVDLKVVAQVLSESGFRVHGPRTRRVWRRILFMPIFMLGGLVRCGHIPSAVLWDLVGFAKMLVAVREPRRGWFESTTAIRAKGLLVNSVVGDGAEGPTAEDAQNTKERVPYRVRCCHLEERAGITSEHMHAQRVA